MSNKNKKNKTKNKENEKQSVFIRLKDKSIDKNMQKNEKKRTNDAVYVIIAWFLMILPLLIRKLNYGLFFPAKSYVILNDFFSLHEGIRKKAYFIVYNFLSQSPDSRLFLIYLIFTLLLVLTIYEVLKALKIEGYFIVLFSANPLILNYISEISLTEIALMFFLTFMYPFLAVVRNIKKVTNFLTQKNIPFPLFFTTLLFITLYPLTFSFALNLFLALLFITLISLTSRRLKEEKNIIKVFVLILFILYLILDFRFFALSQTYNGKFFDVVKSYIHEIKLRFLRIYEEANINAFTSLYDNALFSLVIKKLNFYVPKLFKPIPEENYMINVGKHIIKTYNLIVLAILSYYILILNPGLIYFIFSTYGLIKTKHKTLIILMLLYAIIATIINIHFISLLGILLTILFINGIKNLKLQHFREVAYMIIFALLIFNYLSSFESVKALTPHTKEYLVYYCNNETSNLNTHFLDLSQTPSLNPKKTIFTTLDLNYLFRESSFFQSNDENEFYIKTYKYSEFFKYKYTSEIQSFCEENNIDAIILPITPYTCKSALNTIKNAIWESNTRNIYEVIEFKNITLNFTEIN